MEIEPTPLVKEFTRLKQIQANNNRFPKKEKTLKEKSPVNCFPVDYLRILSRICDILHYQRTKKEILATLAQCGDNVCESSLEKHLRVLREFFDAPIIYNNSEHTYHLELNYNFKKTLIEIL